MSPLHADAEKRRQEVLELQSKRDRAQEQIELIRRYDETRRLREVYCSEPRSVLVRESARRSVGVHAKQICGRDK